jgi:hypothetical protein
VIGVERLVLLSAFFGAAKSCWLWIISSDVDCDVGDIRPIRS